MHVRRVVFRWARERGGRRGFIMDFTTTAFRFSARHLYGTAHLYRKKKSERNSENIAYKSGIFRMLYQCDATRCIGIESCNSSAYRFCVSPADKLLLLRYGVTRLRRQYFPSSLRAQIVETNSQPVVSKLLSTTARYNHGRVPNGRMKHQVAKFTPRPPG